MRCAAKAPREWLRKAYHRVCSWVISLRCARLAMAVSYICGAGHGLDAPPPLHACPSEQRKSSAPGQLIYALTCAAQKQGSIQSERCRAGKSVRELKSRLMGVIATSPSKSTAYTSDSGSASAGSNCCAYFSLASSERSFLSGRSGQYTRCRESRVKRHGVFSVTPSGRSIFRKSTSAGIWNGSMSRCPK